MVTIIDIHRQKKKKESKPNTKDSHQIRREQNKKGEKKIQNNYWNGNRNMKSESRLVMSKSLQPCGLYSPWNSPGQNTGVVSLFLLQGIFPTQGSNPGLPHCKRILYQLSHKGSPTEIYILIISLNANRLNALTKRHQTNSWMDTKIGPVYTPPTRDSFQIQRYIQIESEEMVKGIPCKWKSKESCSSHSHSRQNRL